MVVRCHLYIAFDTFGKKTWTILCILLLDWAIEAGYRHIDTAPIYFNEAQIGEAIVNVTSRGIVKRENLFITTKLDILSNQKAVIPALKESLKKVQLEYVDLYLFHTPQMLLRKDIDFVDIWKGMEDVKLRGLAKSIGISNLNSSQINRILADSRIRKVVNQVEENPTFKNLDLGAYCRSQGIYAMSYSPFGFQIKSNVFDFSLTQQEIYTINEFNLNIALYNFKELDSLYNYMYGRTVKDVLEEVYNM